MNMKRFLAVVLSAMMLLGMMTAATAEVTDGTYAAAAKGNNGDVNVSVTFEGGKITDVTVGEHGETAGICDAAIERIPAAIVENQSVLVDTVSGATNTSNAILTAVKDCIAQAGGAEADFANEVAPAEKSTATETYDADVVVVGAGGSGVAAALAATQQGAKVIVLEKAANIGGSSIMSAGMAAVDSSFQQADENTTFTAAEWMKQWLEQQNYMVSAPMIYKYITESGATVDWLVANGLTVDFIGHRQLALLDDPIRTYHVWDGDGLAAALGRYIEQVTANGGALLTETAGKSLIMKDGAAAGVIAEKADGTTVTVNAKSVVIATGGYGASAEKMQEVLGFKANGINSGAQTGDGIQMGIDAGAATEGYTNVEFHGAHSAFDLQGDLPDGGALLNSMAINPSGLWINVDGYRFTNEDICYDSSYIGNVAAKQGDHYYVLINQSILDTLETKGEVGLGRTTAGTAFGAPGPALEDPWTGLTEQIEAGLANGITVKGDTLEELAANAGVDAEQLVKTVEAYNASCAAGVDEMYSKEAQFLTAIDAGPYYLVMGRTTELCTLGGLKINTSMQVISTENAVIPGLYSAGVDCSGSMYNNAYVSFEGVTMGWVMTSGRLAGESAGTYALQ